ncbi:hypothetical protein DB30_04041 [Enhygromyxa salina]|uniref:Uncharacterized protein n=1 Tax=Enhygromyxa salina TaxID=215803 RepID=A0A0C1ZGV8_9BACT|nr:hypothetical protein DB30_04041 [Enhygromyxa salina]
MPLPQARRAERARYRAFADQLRERGIVDTASATELNQAIDRHAIHSLLDIVPYCPRARVIRLSDYAEHEHDSRAYLEAMHADVASIMPELAFSAFEGCAEADGCGGALDRWFAWVASLEHNGNDYGQYMDGLDEVTAGSGSGGTLGRPRDHRGRTQARATHDRANESCASARPHTRRVVG